MIWKFDACGFDFQSVQLSGIQPELYSVYQAAKAISTGSRNITLADLASPELVTDEAFHLIVCTLLYRRLFPGHFIAACHLAANLPSRPRSPAGILRHG